MSLFGKNQDKVYLLIDIGSGSLTVSFVLYKRNDLPVFLHTTTKDFIITSKPNGTKLFENMIKTLEGSLDEITKEGRSHKYWKSKNSRIGGAVISFSSPWFMPKTKHIQITEDKPFIISQKFIDGVVKQEEVILLGELNETSGVKEDFEVIEKNIVHMKINGYVLKNYIGHKTNVFDAYLCMSVISQGVVNKIYDTVLRHTHIPKESILCHTFPLVSFSVLRDLYSNHSNFIIIDTTSEVTDITLIENDIISNTSSFPSGKNFVLREIAKSFGVSVEIAQSNLSLFLAGKLDSEMNSKMENIIENVENDWITYFEKALSEITADKTLPKRTYITADPDIANLYTTFLKQHKFEPTSLFKKNADVVYVENKFLNGHYKNDSITTPNVFIVILAIFYNKILNRK